ncbi:HEAT repeat domain-containing protein [Microcoleus sp. S13_C5]|uniref:HEAT repeat domain-containing protein n=1 Tax=Microcoleus sp. S13_C5 TaxID=3055411 RepID=UPI002FD37B23
MVDPVSAGLGLGWLLVGPILQDLAKAALDDYVKDFFKDCIKDVEGLAKKPFAQNAVREAIKYFTQCFEQELQRSQLDKKQIQQYLQPLKQFIKQPPVRQVLGNAFQRNCRVLNTAILADSWQTLILQHPLRRNLPTFTRIVPSNLLKEQPTASLPDAFSWERVAEKYLASVKLIIQQNAELREILNAQNLDGILGRLTDSSPISADFNLESYQEGLREQYEYLDLGNLDTRSGEYERQLTVKEIFIPQNVRSCQEYLPKDYELPKEIQKLLRERGDIAAEVRPEDLERYQKAYTQQQADSILKVIDDVNYPYLVILGDPGSGKSTLLKYLALQWAKQSPNQLSSQPIHLLIELRKYNRSRDEKECSDFLEFMERGSSWIGHLNKSILHEWLQAGRAVVMFDGLDEAFEVQKRNRIVDQIHNFTQTYPTVKVIVTSRVIGYQQQRLKNAEFHHFMLQDFEPEQIQDFIQKWHELTFTDRLKKAASLERLDKAIGESRAIQELAGNPLLLTMMAILNRNQELPRFRAKLYEEASKVLLHKWDFEVKEELSNDKIDPRSIDEEVKQSICRRIAYKMQSSEKGLAGNIISRDDLRQTIAESLSGLMGTEATACAKLMVEQLRERNFILCFLGGYNEDYYAFVHRTFLEYFCAWEFVRQFEKEQTRTLNDLIQVYREHWRDESWHEVLRLMAGMLDAKFTGDILEYLIGENGEADKFSNLFLAAQCVSEVKNRNDIAVIASQLCDRVKELTKYRNINGSTPPEYDSLVFQIRTQAVAAIAATWKDDPQTLPWLKQLAQSDDDWLVPYAAVQALAWGWKDDPETLPILKQLAQSDDNEYVRSSAVQKLARGWKDDSETLPILKQLAQSDDGSTVRRAAVQELARGWKDDPETLPILKQLAQSGDDGNVRQLAVQEIARGWKDDPETLPILKQRAQSDDNGSVRQAALQELARGWKDDPKTLPILKQLAQSDNDATVRQLAVQELVRGWKDDPETLPILKQLAQSDDGATVRCAALQELVRGWKNDPETLPILKQRAQCDDNWYVLYVAVQEIARGWKDDPETLPWLKQSAQSHEDGDVRSSAVRELARGWKDDPELFELLCDVAINDPFDRKYILQNNPRQTALAAMIELYPDRPQTLELVRDRAQNDSDETLREFAQEKLAELERE